MGKSLCPSIGNQDQFGWDECTKDPGHAGDHWDDISKHAWPQTETERMANP
jgi:hypothetical protein